MTSSNILSYFCEFFLGLLILAHFFRSFFSKDKTLIWSPVTAISLTYIYYCSVPFWGGTIEQYVIDESYYDGHLFHIAALISYVSILIGFYTTSNTTFKTWNSLINENNVGIYGLLLFVIGVVGYGMVRGFHFTFAAEEDVSKEIAIGGFTYYFMMMLDLLPFAAGLLYVKLKQKRKKWLYLAPFWFIIVDFLFAGARWRIVVMLFVLLTLHHLYPKIRKMNVPIILCLAIVCFLGFSIMDRARMRGRGIDISVAKTLKFDEIKEGAAENYSVYWFSVICMDQINKTGDRIYLQPIVASIFMPIPRFLFPWKPDASYLNKLDGVFDDSGGAAYLNFVESYYSFGWFGIVIWGWFLGWLARKIWGNYLFNRNKIGSIVALGSFSGFCYVAISRGYLPASFTTFLLAICVPFWIIQFIGKRIK